LRGIGLFRIIILKWTVKAYDIRMGTAFLWLRTEFSLGLLIMVINIQVSTKE